MYEHIKEVASQLERLLARREYQHALSSVKSADGKSVLNEKDIARLQKFTGQIMTAVALTEHFPAPNEKTPDKIAAWYYDWIGKFGRFHDTAVTLNVNEARWSRGHKPKLGVMVKRMIELCNAMSPVLQYWEQHMRETKRVQLQTVGDGLRIFRFDIEIQQASLRDRLAPTSQRKLYQIAYNGVDSFDELMREVAKIADDPALPAGAAAALSIFRTNPHSNDLKVEGGTVSIDAAGSSYRP